MKKEFVKLALTASETYLEYLKKNNRGVFEIGVKSVRLVDERYRVWEFELRRRLYDIDSIQLRFAISDCTVAQEDFVVQEYDADTRLLVLKFTNIPSDLNKDVSPEQISVVTSLRFLVENVRKWFVTNGTYLCLPSASAEVDERSGDGAVAHRSLDVGGNPHSEQVEAINTVLRRPLTYVWGPPGTGKTRLVLTHAALSLVLGGFRVGVFAPTNLALEQAMDALLEGAARLGIEERDFLRLGAPSRSFSAKYPSVCEVQALQKRIKEAERQIEILNDVINYQLGLKALHSGESLLVLLEKIETEFGKRQVAIREIAGLRRDGEELDLRLGHISIRLKELLTGKPSPERIRRDVVNTREVDAVRRLSEIDARINDLATDFSLLDTDSEKLALIQNRFNPRNWEQAAQDVASMIEKTREWLLVREAIAARYQDTSLEELQTRKEDWESKLEALSSATVTERIKRSRVVGMTLDVLIGRFRESPPDFDHNFLDEAGYAPLIKSLALYRHGQPVTMLGDHKQLPPVLELSDDELENETSRSVHLWSAMAVNSDVVFNDELTCEKLLDVLSQLQQGNELALHNTVLVTLKTSRRFGSNLCDVLDGSIYNIGLQSANDSDLDIRFINALPAEDADSPREALGEVNAIAALLGREKFEDMAILTPYKNQRDLLFRTFPELAQQDRILTIHKSQGREWDTVILSVVDGSGPGQPWFADTANPKSRGVHVINTAVSRAKKRLIIVCNVAFWTSRGDSDSQLISRLLACGKETASDVPA